MDFYFDTINQYSGSKKYLNKSFFNMPFEDQLSPSNRPAAGDLEFETLDHFCQLLIKFLQSYIDESSTSIAQ
jgi:hypothetical protein